MISCQTSVNICLALCIVLQQNLIRMLLLDALREGRPYPTQGEFILAGTQHGAGTHFPIIDGVPVSEPRMKGGLRVFRSSAVLAPVLPHEGVGGADWTSFMSEISSTAASAKGKERSLNTFLRNNVVCEILFSRTTKLMVNFI